MRSVALLSFLLTLAFTPLAIWVLHHLGVIDVPTPRSSHVAHTPRGGGVGVVLGTVSGMLLAGTAGVVEAWALRTLLICSSFFAIVGFVDDIRTLDVKPRLAAQLGCVALLVGPWFFENGRMGASLAVRLVLAVVAVIWVMGYLNAFNFMDGINGVSGFHAIVAGVTFAWVGYSQHHRIVAVCGVAIAASAAGFLPYNFPRARVFLGDVGSYFIGTWIAISALIALVWDAPPEAVFAPLLIYLADTSFTLADRIRRGKNWRESHHDHVYQQLVERGWSHTRTTAVVTTFSATCAVLGLVSLTQSVPARLAADVAIVAVLLGYLALPRLLGRTAPEPAARTTGNLPTS